MSQYEDPEFIHIGVTHEKNGRTRIYLNGEEVDAPKGDWTLEIYGAPWPYLETPSRARPGRFLEIGPLEIETRTYEGPHVFFDPIGSVNTCECTFLSDDELDEKEERGELGVSTEAWLTPDSKPPVYGGSLEFNFRGYRLNVILWKRWAHTLCNWLNAKLWDE